VALECVRNAHADGREPILVLPSQPDVQHAANELARGEALGFRVTTFDGYLEDAWGRCGDGRAIVRSSSRRLLSNAAARKAGAGTGMGELAASCVTTLAAQTGERWRQARPNVGDSGARLSQTILNYRDSLIRLGLVEKEEAAFALAENPGLPGDPLVVHRFTDFTAWQERMLLGAAATRDVLVTLTWEDGFAPTEALSPLVGRLGASVERALLERFHEEPELREVADALYSSPVPQGPGGALRFSLAEGYEAEAHRIAEETLEALAEYGNSGGTSSIAVVFRHPERHVRFLREAFDEAGIEAEFDVRTPLGATAFGAAVLGVVGFLVSSDRDQLLAVLKSPFGGGDRGTVIELEREWRSGRTIGRPQLVDGLWKASKELQRLIRRADKASSGGINAVAAREIAGSVTALLVLGYGRAGDISTVSPEDAAAHAAIQRLLGEVATVDDEAIVLADVRDALNRTIVTTNTTERPDAVQVMAVDRIRGRRFGTVVIGGLNSDEFPQSASESMQPGSSVATVLSAFGGHGESAKGVEYEQLLFYMALTRAEKRVVLSARTADSDGDPAGVSALFEAVADFYRPLGEDSRPPYKFRALSQTPTNSALATAREVLRANAQSDLVGDLRSVAARWRGSRRVAGLRTQASLERLAGAHAYSPSAIEAYLRCPYAWFHSNTIRAQTLETEFDAREQGSLAHDVLARAYASMLSAGVPRVTDGSLDLAREAVQIAWDEIVSERGETQSVLELSERRATLSWATRIIEDDATFAEGFFPSRIEWGFGPNQEHSVDMGGFSLKGRIDRVDVDAAGKAIVIDYKRGTGPTAADILAKRRIQVPLYMEAVRLALGLEPVAGIYRGLRKRSDRGLLLAGAGVSGAFTSTDLKDEAEFRRIVEEALALARDAVARMREGRIEQAPHDPSSCKTCSALSVCGGPR